MPKSKKALYTWTWIGGGYNQHYAHTKKEAMKYATELGAPNLKVDLSSFKRTNAVQEKSYWDNFPIFD